MACCPSTSNVLGIGSDMDIGLTGVRASATGTYLNSGSATWELFDADGDSAGTGAMAYVAASDGDYAGTIESTVTNDLEENAFYALVYTFSQGGYQLEIRRRVQAIYFTS